ncbi:MAG: thiol-disulfide oxidoreductase [Rhodomicrobium sp.]|nr:MAG: thiol-disulfide oxidoreductase [Rhodomicrobium sp.]
MADSSARKLFSYLDSIENTGWNGQRPLIVFDGVCVLCSHFVKWVVRHDSEEKFQFTMAQSPLGQSLYDHFGLNSQEFETNLVIIDGQLFEKLDAMIAVFEMVGGPWRLLSVFKPLPRGLKNWIYERIARNRYALFGQLDSCMVPDENFSKRMVG